MEEAEVTCIADVSGEIHILDVDVISRSSSVPNRRAGKHGHGAAITTLDKTSETGRTGRRQHPRAESRSL